MCKKKTVERSVFHLDSTKLLKNVRQVNVRKLEYFKLKNSEQKDIKNNIKS